MHSVLEYLKTNAYWLIPVVVVILTNIANGLTNHPETKGILLTISKLIDQLPTTVLAKKSAPGQTFKLPLASSNWPADHPLNPAIHTDKTSQGPKSVLPMLFWWVTIAALGGGTFGITSAALSACNAAQKAGWANVEAGILKNCATAGNAGKVVQDIVSDSEQPGATPQSVAEAVVASDGIELALCAFEQIVANGGALLGASETPAHQLAYEAAQYGLAHKDELRAKVQR